MNDQPLVSVNIIFFNAEKFLEEAIEGVLNQTYENWELLLADDGSLDASTAIAKKYTNLYPQKIYYVEHKGHKNLGMSAARNLGVRHSKGKYIALLDADDFWLPDKLSDQVRILENNPEAGMLCGAVKHWYSWDSNNADNKKDVIKFIGAPQNVLISPPKMFQYLYPLGTGEPPTPSDILIKKEVIERIGGFEETFRNEHQLYEDQSFLNRVYLYFPVYISSETWTMYRRHVDSCVSSVHKAGQYHKVRKFFFLWFERYLIKHNQRNTDVWFLLQKELLCYRPFFIRKLKKGLSKVKRFLYKFLAVN